CGAWPPSLRLAARRRSQAASIDGAHPADLALGLALGGHATRAQLQLDALDGMAAPLARRLDVEDVFALSDLAARIVTPVPGQAVASGCARRPRHGFDQLGVEPPEAPPIDVVFLPVAAFLAQDEQGPHQGAVLVGDPDSDIGIVIGAGVDL